MGPYEDTPPSTASYHVTSYDICYAKMYDTRLILIKEELGQGGKPNLFDIICD